MPVFTLHRCMHVQIVQLGAAVAELPDPGVRVADLLDQLPPLDTRLDRDKQTPRLRMLFMDQRDKPLEVCTDFFRCLPKGEVVVAGVEHDEPGFVGEYDPRRVTDGIGDL